MFAISDETGSSHVKNKVPLSILAVVVTIGVGFLSSLTTDTSSAWYTSLVLSPLQPPPLTFSIVWTCLYTILAIVFVLLIKNNAVTKRNLTHIIVNLALNASWSAVFFLAYNTVLSLVILIIMIINIILFMMNLKHSVKVAMFLLIPYLVWLCIATFLNISVLVLN